MATDAALGNDVSVEPFFAIAPSAPCPSAVPSLSPAADRLPCCSYRLDGKARPILRGFPISAGPLGVRH
jgi:hypothetical protein